MAVSRISRDKLKFVMGFCLGITASFLLMSYQQMNQGSRLTLNQWDYVIGGLQVASPDQRELSEHEMEARLHEACREAKAVKFEDLHAHHDNDSIATELYKRVRILVWISTCPDNLDKRAVHVRNTWGKRANKLLFMSYKWNTSFPTIGLNVSNGREHLTAKSLQAFRYVYQHHLNDADWFMKADDDTYVIMENLRYLLSSYNTEDPIYFGHIFKALVKQGYPSGGAGYVLSKEALRRLVPNSAICRQDGSGEDAAVGQCLMELGVKIQSSLDRLNRSRFHCFWPEAHLQGNYPEWYLQYDAQGARKGMDSISDYPISFHYIEPSQKMYDLDYFVYHMKVHGIVSRTQSLNLDNNRRK